jgi:hypothetical protein
MRPSDPRHPRCVILTRLWVRISVVGGSPGNSGGLVSGLPELAITGSTAPAAGSSSRSQPAVTGPQSTGVSTPGRPPTSTLDRPPAAIDSATQYTGMPPHVATDFRRRQGISSPADGRCGR